ncbi:Glyoxylase, beta-lactamase superfamily II [Alteribacillus persepolensis]|uniref:Glyoxylase, beta-lactamase superfamily II n=1 Tax=Alteribacillus persepolensis TaxID=568899 RepID=A0A1G8JIN6_9BACI|nr:MBL fold metallo-hydrolase [Alteribacillus persepolensis]SDI30951.1 Glyoxylase, beta-lactamase superfamily II [Alteribacillus persepolensis]
MSVQYQDNNVTVFESVLLQTTSTVVATKEMILIVDPTWLPDEIHAIQQHVQSIDNGQEKYLLFTHSDFDHILGYNAFPEAVTIASRGFVEKTDKQEVIQEILQFDDQYYIQRPYLIEYPQIDTIIDFDNQTVRAGDTDISFYLAPGHQADGVFAVIQDLGILIAGDYLSDVEFPFIEHHSKAYEQTLEKLEESVRERRISLLIPGHGKATTDQEEIKDRIEDSKWYIEACRKEVTGSDSYKVLQAFVDSFLFSRYLEDMHEANLQQIRQEENTSSS